LDYALLSRCQSDRLEGNTSELNIAALHSVGGSAAKQPTCEAPLRFLGRRKEGMNVLNDLVRELMERMEEIALCTGGLGGNNSGLSRFIRPSLH
jgi:hypothetical protein